MANEEINNTEIKAESPVRISISAGEMMFQPAAYNTFKVGAVFVSSDVLPGETPETTAARLTKIALDAQRAIYKQQRDLFWEGFAQRHEATPVQVQAAF